MLSYDSKTLKTPSRRRRTGWLLTHAKLEHEISYNDKKRLNQLKL